MSALSSALAKCGASAPYHNFSMEKLSPYYHSRTTKTSHCC